jgi:uncharacterized protein
MEDPEDSSTTDAALRALPIFPLPGVVFFPHTLLPLHIFEPRYRQLTEHVLQGHQCMAVTLIADPVDTNHCDIFTTPAATAVATVAGLGRVVHHERLPDGRFHLLLQGVGRVRIMTELPRGELLYRRVHACWHGERAIDDKDTKEVAVAIEELRSCYSQLMQQSPETREALGDLPLRLTDAHVVADIVCATVIEDVHLRQQALECQRVVERLALAQEAVAQMLLRTMPSGGLLN